MAAACHQGSTDNPGLSFLAVSTPSVIVPEDLVAARALSAGSARAVDVERAQGSLYGTDPTLSG